MLSYCRRIRIAFILATFILQSFFDTATYAIRGLTLMKIRGGLQNLIRYICSMVRFYFLRILLGFLNDWKNKDEANIPIILYNNIKRRCANDS